jgi:hypothetical protein
MQHHTPNNTAAAAVATAPAAAWDATSAPAPFLTASHSAVTAATSAYWRPVHLLLLLQMALHSSCAATPLPTAVSSTITLPVTATIFVTWLLRFFLLPCPTAIPISRPSKVLQAIVFISITTIIPLLLLLLLAITWLFRVRIVTTFLLLLLIIIIIFFF